MSYMKSIIKQVTKFLPEGVQIVEIPEWYEEVYPYMFGYIAKMDDTYLTDERLCAAPEVDRKFAEYITPYTPCIVVPKSHKEMIKYLRMIQPIIDPIADMELDDDMLIKFIILHEIAHAVDFYHMKAYDVEQMLTKAYNEVQMTEKMSRLMDDSIEVNEILLIERTYREMKHEQRADIWAVRKLMDNFIID